MSRHNHNGDPSKLTKSRMLMNTKYLSLKSLQIFLALGLFAQIASAATLNIVLSSGKTGTPNFGGAIPCKPELIAQQHVSGTTYEPGEDACDGDAVVRSRDIWSVAIEYSVNAGDGKNVTIIATAPVNTKWSEIPPQCLAPDSDGTNPASSVSADGTVLTCNVGSVKSGTAVRMQPQLYVLGSARNFDLLTVSAKIQADLSSTVNSNSVSARVSAAPKFDLRNYAGYGATKGLGPDGVTMGRFMGFYVHIFSNNGGKGTEPLTTGNITFDKFLTYSNGRPNNAQIYTWGPLGAAGGCGLMRRNALPNAGPNFQFVDVPYGSIALSDGRPHGAVSDSGQITCSQAAPGAKIGVTISGMDSTMNHVPDSQGLAIRYGEPDTKQQYVFSGFIQVWIPLSDVLEVGVLDITSEYKNFDPTSVTGLSNFGAQIEPLANNKAVRREFATGTAVYSFSKQFRIPKDGATYGTPGSQRQAGIGFGNGSDVATYRNITICDKFDNKYLSVAEDKSAGVPPGHSAVHQYAAPRWTGYQSYTGAYKIEYAAGPAWTSLEQQAYATCDDADGPWYPTIDAVPTGLESINKIRMFQAEASPLAPQAVLSLLFKVKDNAPAGIKIPNFGSFKTPDVANGAWQHDNVDPNEVIKDLPYKGSGYSDRLIISKIFARISKKIVTGNTLVDSAASLVGKEVVFELAPSITGGAGGIYNTTYTVTDILPADLVFDPASATVAPTSVTPNADGTTTIVWNVNYSSGQPPQKIRFTALVSSFATDSITLENCAEISSPDDATMNDKTQVCGHPFRPLSSKAVVRVTNPSAFTITKSVDKELIGINSVAKFKINYRNTASFDLTSTDIIDVLPFNGDGSDVGPDGQDGTLDDFHRIPPTKFAGTAKLLSLEGTNGEVFSCTKAPHKSISRDPTAASNAPGGATTWCDCNNLAGGACPANMAEVTGIRSKGPAFPAKTPVRSFTLTLQTNNNNSGDIYTNNFGAKAGGLVLPVFSNDVSVTVIAGSVSNQVFSDLNGDGVYQPEAGEFGIASVKVSVFLDTNGNGKVDAGEVEVGSAITDGKGQYSIKNVPVGLDGSTIKYVVKVSDPNSVLKDFRSTLGAPGADGHGQNPDGFSVSLTENAKDIMNADFSYQQLGQIGDFVWKDLNSNGIQDDGEPGFEEVTVTLLDENGAVVKSTKTDAQGLYSFTGLVPAKYKIKFTLPSGFEFSPVGAGNNIDKDSNAAKDGSTGVIELLAGENNRSIDAGIFLPVGSIGDFLWKDLNANGIQDAGEPGFEGVTVTLLNEQGAVVKTSITDAQGLYRFTDILAGKYRVKFTLPKDYEFSPSNKTADKEKDSNADKDGLSELITLNPSQNNLSIDAGVFLPVGSIGDFVWKDVNGNGVQDAGEAGFEGISVTLLNEQGAVLKTTKTDAQGLYKFTDLLPGKYRVKFALPNGFEFSPSGTAADKEKDSNADKAGLSELIILGSSQNNLSVDAGLKEVVVVVNCTPSGNNSSLQVAVDANALGVKNRLNRWLDNKIRRANSCKDLSKNAASELAAQIDSSYQFVWGSVWTNIPTTFFSCPGQIIPQNCQSVDTSKVKTNIAASIDGLAALADKVTASCRNVNKTRVKTFREGIIRRATNAKNPLASVPDSVIKCQ